LVFQVGPGAAVLPPYGGVDEGVVPHGVQIVNGELTMDAKTIRSSRIFAVTTIPSSTPQSRQRFDLFSRVDVFVFVVDVFEKSRAVG
jgi:hypothetical protein